MRTEQRRNRILREPAHKEGVWGVRQAGRDAQLGPGTAAGELSHKTKDREDDTGGGA